MTESGDAVDSLMPGEPPSTTKTFKFEAGKADIASFREYLASLPPAQVAAAMDHMIARGADVAFEPGEAEEIIREIIARDRYVATVTLFKGLQLRLQSLSEEDYAAVAGIPTTGGDEVAVSRARQLQMVRASVTHENGKQLPSERADAEKYWRAKPYALLDMIGASVVRFDRKVRAALGEAEVVGKS